MGGGMSSANTSDGNQRSASNRAAGQHPQKDRQQTERIAAQDVPQGARPVASLCQRQRLEGVAREGGVAAEETNDEQKPPGGIDNQPIAEERQEYTDGEAAGHVDQQRVERKGRA